MKAKFIHESYRQMFFCGGMLDVLCCQEPEVQLLPDPANFSKLGPVKICPCGCGLKNDICDVAIAKAKVINDEIPF